jgi:hypothetical protein
MRIRRRTPRNESGFTLAELILTIAIETIIFGALATAFVVVLNGGTSVKENLGKSSDARFAANYIISDARNSSGPEISLTDIASCADPTPPVAGPQTAVARFNWNATNPNGSTTANIADYVLVSGSLLRRHCEAGVLVSDSVLANDVANVTVTCAPNADCTDTPVSITVTITETVDKAGGTPYTYSLTAAFRKLIASGGSITPPAPEALIVLGTGGCAITVKGSAELHVYGDVLVDAVDTGNCTAIDLNGAADFTAGSTSILQGGTCSGSACPAGINSYPIPNGDPYDETPVPPAQPARTNACNGSSGSATTSAGEYAAPFALQGSVNCTLASGIYVFDAGFSISSSATLTTAPGGVLIYVKGGQFNINGGGTVTLAAMTTGPYAGLVVWQDASDTETFNLTGNGVVVFGGVVYVPNATVNISGTAAGTKATSIVALNVVMDGSAHMTIGAPATPLSIAAPATLPAWTINRAYSSTTLTAAGGDGNYTWSQTGLPNGMALDANTGVISGTPTVAGTAAVTVTLNDALGDAPVTRNYALKINAAPVITTVTPLPSGEKTAPYSTTIATTGGTAPFAWTATGLPAGLAIGASTGIISGAPTAVGTSSVTVALTDAAGATVSKANLVLVIAAQPTIVSVALANGTGTLGRIDKGDTIKVVFSAQMRVSSICSSWLTDSNDQSITADNAVMVTLTDAATDTISVTATPTCTFNFGLLDLAVNTYISGGNAVFGGASTNKSTVSWTVSTKTLLITLGAKGATGTVSTVGTSTPIYTAGPMLDTVGGALGNSPFTIAAGKKF